MLESYLDVIETFTGEIRNLEEAIEKRAGSLTETQLLMTIPGVSYYTALTIYAELGDISRFDRDKSVVSYVGLNPVIRESPDSRIEGSTWVPRDFDSRLSTVITSRRKLRSSARPAGPQGTP